MSRLFDGTAGLAGDPPYRDMVEAAPAAMILVDAAGHVLLVNAEAERMFGYPRVALLGKPAEMLLPASVADRHLVFRAGEKGAGRQMNGAARDLFGLRADGSELPIEVGLTPLETPQGPCVLAVITDLTERARAESARAYLAAIVDSSDDGIIGKTLEGIVTSWNRAAETILGWPEWEIVGKPILLIIPPDRRDEERRILSRVCSGGRVEDLATVRQRRDGTLIPVSITVSPIRDRTGRVIGASKILRDATERHRGERAMIQANAALELAVAERTRELAQQQAARQRAEAAFAQAQKLEAVGQLTGGVAHDFNNLLTVIAGNLDLIADRLDDNERLTRAISGIGRAVERGARLTSHLLAFARRQALQPELLRLDDVVREFSVLMMRAVGEVTRLSLDTDEDLWPCLVDRGQFESAILNLAINARDAMPQGGVLAFTLYNVVEDGQTELPAGRYVCVQVADTGAGMVPEVMAHAVEPFFTTKDVGRGSGLGLSQVYGFLQQSGGALRIDSEPDKGTRITLLFPAHSPAE
jgi:PAS domain S-box-containing protein